MLQIEFNPDWKIGDIIRPGDGHEYKIVKKTNRVIAVKRYYFWQKWFDKWVKK
jgi:hypothetical protein